MSSPVEAPMTDVEPIRAARGYTWEPFVENNDAALVHGAWSRRRTAPIEAAALDHLAAAAPWTASDAFAGARASWAHAEAQAELLRADLDKHGMFDDEGEERAAVRSLDRVEGRLAKLREALGLTPRALGQLLATAASVATATGDAASLEALKAEGRKVLAARLDTTNDHDEDEDETC
ncbi:MAG: hypothetical protein JWN46_79 [Acidimicrobiales bacterium]|nr:hypothetical protein [Acidimicrobiales bacterium]